MYRLDMYFGASLLKREREMCMGVGVSGVIYIFFKHNLIALLYDYVPVLNYCNVFIFYELFYSLFYKYLFYISSIYY